MDKETTLTGCVAAGTAMTLLGQSPLEAQRSIGSIVALQVTDDHRLLECENHGKDNTGKAST